MDTRTTIRVALAFAASAAIVAYGDAADPCTVLLREIGAVNAGDEDFQNKLDVVERSCVERFMALPYARLPVSLMEPPVDFNTRIRCIEEIAKFDLLREDTNVLASISTHIEGLKPLPIDRQLDDAKAARTILLHLCYTQEQVDEFNNFKPDGKTMRGALLTHPAYGDLFAAIDREYAFRRLYNARLERYKREALKTIRDSVQGERRKRRVVPSRTPGSVNFPTAGICPTAAEAPRDRDIAVAVEFEQTQDASARPVVKDGERQSLLPFADFAVDCEEQQSYLEGVGDQFPSYGIVLNELGNVRLGFCAADPQTDNWLGFLPLYRLVLEHQHTAPSGEVSFVEAHIVTNFTLYAFAAEDEQNPSKARFHGRLQCLELLAQFQQVAADTNTLFRLADWLAGATALPTDRESWGRDIARAHRIDNHRIFGDNMPPRIAGGVGRGLAHWGPEARKCNDKYDFRRRYNDRLPAFRAAALGCFNAAIANGYKDCTADEKTAIWDEFCRRAKATEEERNCLNGYQNHN